MEQVGALCPAGDGYYIQIDRIHYIKVDIGTGEIELCEFSGSYPFTAESSEGVTLSILLDCFQRANIRYHGKA